MVKLRRKQDVKPLIIFLHIPKTAGSTLRSLLRRKCQLNGVLDLPTITSSVDREGVQKCLDTFNNVPEEQKKEIQCLRGHLYFGLHEFFPHQPTTYITMLRDPVERVISLYYYLRRDPNSDIIYRDNPEDRFQVQNMTLEEFVSSGITLEINNGQTRRLAGLEEKSEVCGFGIDSWQMLEKAKKNLYNSFSAFGLMEDFDRSLLLLKRVFGWRNVFYYKSNVTKKDSDKYKVSEETMDILVKYNKLDIELYNYAKSLFQERLTEQDSAFATEAKMFQVINPIYGRFYAVAASATNRIKRSLDLS